MDGMGLLQAVILLAVGAALTLITTAISDRRAEKRTEKERSHRQADAIRSDGRKHAEAVLDLLARLERYVDGLMDSDGFANYSVDMELMRELEQEVALVPDAILRDYLSKGVSILFAIEDVVAHTVGPVEFSYTPGLTIGSLRGLVSAYLRGEQSETDGERARAYIDEKVASV